MAYTAYFDESGHPDSGQFVVVAGAVADIDQWIEFQREWLDALGHLGTVFHTTDFNSGTPPFDKLTEDDKDMLFERLVGIICRHVEKTCAVTVALEEFKRANKKYLLAEQHGFPYPLAARSCMAGVGQWAHYYSFDVNNILFVFEDGAKHKGQIKLISERDGLPIPRFEKKSEITALQAGDLIAWCIHAILTKAAKAERYEKGLRRIAEMPKTWRDVDLRDPDRLPTILGIALRDPAMKYECRIVRQRGKRRAVITQRPKNAPGQFKIDRKNDVIPEARHISLEEYREAARRYDEAKAALPNALP